MASRGDILAGKAAVELAVKDDKFRAALRRSGEMLKGFGSSVGAIGGVLAKSGAAFAGLGAAALAALKPAIDAASNLSETMSKATQIFGKDSLPGLEAFADGAAKALGQSKQQALDAAATFATFGKSAGLTGGDLVGFSTELTSLASDLASFGNTSPEEAIVAIGAALRGESEPIRSYGVLLDDATLRQQAFKLGLIKSTKEALTPANKVLAAHAEIMRQTADAQGDFARTAGGLANQQRILAATWKDMQTKLGAALLPTVEAFTSKANALMTIVSDWIGRNTELAGTIARAAAAAVAIGAAVATLGVGMIGAGMAISGIVTALSAAATAAAFLVTPLGAVIAAAAALGTAVVAAFATVIAKSEELQTLVGESLGRLVELAKGIGSSMGDAFRAGDMALAWEIAVTGLKVTLIQTLHDMLEAAKQFAADFGKALLPSFQMMADFLADPAAFAGKKLGELFSGGASTGPIDIQSGFLTKAGIDSAKRLAELQKQAADQRQEKETADAAEAATKAAAMPAKAPLTLPTPAADTPPDIKSFGLADLDVGIDDVLAAVSQQSGVQKIREAANQPGTQGTFSAAAAQAMGRGGMQERLARAGEKTAKNTDMLVKKFERLHTGNPLVFR